MSSSFTGSHSDLETVFSLFPVIQVSYTAILFICTLTFLSLHVQEKDTILVESYARIKHLQTRTWLHLEKGMSRLTYLVKNLNFVVFWRSPMAAFLPILYKPSEKCLILRTKGGYLV